MTADDGQTGPPAARQIRPAPRLEVIGEDADGREVVHAVLGHGDDPELLFADSGWLVGEGVSIGSDTSAGHVLTARLRVSAAGSRRRASTPALLREEGLVVEDDEEPTVYQRVAAYAVVTSHRGVLMTEYSDRTGAPGAWGLPGGGLDPGEAPTDAVLREVWEESGQHVTVGRFVGLRTRHWVGRAPNGRLEDYHAVRILFCATCDDPTEPVVHDVGGTTASAAWVAPERLGSLEITSGWRPVLEDLLGGSHLRTGG
ncbi:NUDIX hydrolase [Segeticoccus rhizosphaerae]|uniref:NUDIX hydrolase n=1 Tax=Segeticoccus rhizosphaerae TaxID=1104777 RepID=UPI00192E579B|nr:NUDIX domain-containing protein [Ornithinicoccus soli]